MASVKKNFAMQTTYQILSIITPLITAPYLTRVLGAEKLGVFSFTESIANYFVLAAMLGISTYGQRAIAAVRDDRAAANTVFCEIFCAHCVVSCVSLLIYLVYASFFNRQYQLYNFIWGFYVLSAVFDISWLFFGLEDFKSTVTRNVIVKLLTVFCILAFVKDRNDLLVYIIIISGSFLVSQLSLWTLVWKRVSFAKVQIRVSFRHIKPMAVHFLAVIAVSIYRMMDKVMLGNANLTAELGCYDYADKLIKIPIGLITALGTIMLPRMTNLFARDKTGAAREMLVNSVRVVFFMSSAMMFGMMAIADDFAVIYLGKEFAASGKLVKVLALSILFMGWNNFLRSQYLIPMKKDRVYVAAVWTGAITNAVLNYILISKYSALGAAIATDIAYSCVSLVQTGAVFRELPVVEFLKRGGVFMIFGFIMYIAVKAVRLLLPMSIAGLVLEILFGASVYILLCLFFLYKKDKDVLRNGLSQIRRIGRKKQ